MKAKFTKALVSFGKYILWTAIAGGITYLTGAMDSVPAQYQMVVVPLLGSILKAAATYAATQVDEAGQEIKR